MSGSTYKKVLGVIFAALLLVGIGFFLINKNEIPSEDTILPGENTGKEIQTPASYKDGTYMIDGVLVSLTEGVSEIEDLDSSSIIETRYFGNEVMHDLNGDGREDVIFLVTQSTGGTGFFYYVVAALNTQKGYIGSQALFLGDRIAPQTTEMGKGNIIVVNYLDRKAGESFSTQPSVGKRMWLLLDINTMQFGEVVQNFEGEANPNKMTLGMKKWTWISTLYNDERVIAPKKTQAFALEFGKDGRFSATTDCNQVAGSYTVSPDKIISFGEMISTKMFCEGSQENEFTQMLSTVSGYHFTSKGNLVLDIKFDSGSMTFR